MADRKRSLHEMYLVTRLLSPRAWGAFGNLNIISSHMETSTARAGNKTEPQALF
jgi:hypothetical protein